MNIFGAGFTSTAELSTEDLERFARNVWADLSRPRLETALRDGVRDGTWAAWRKGDDEAFFTRDDTPSPAITVGPVWSLVDMESPLAKWSVSQITSWIV